MKAVTVSEGPCAKTAAAVAPRSGAARLGVVFPTDPEAQSGVYVTYAFPKLSGVLTMCRRGAVAATAMRYR
jgi:hypothetical protein